jgi:outer membrane protein assembly factor BamB
MRLRALLLICLILAACTFSFAESPSLRVAWRYAMPKTVEAQCGVDGQIAVVGDASGNVHAIDLAGGKPLWKVALPAAVTSAPAFTADFVLIGDDAGTLHCLRRRDGQSVWTSKSDGKIVGRPTVAPPRVLFGSYDQHVYCVDLATGKELWRFESGAQVHASVALRGDLVISGGCDGFLRAIHLDNGKEAWSTQLDGPVAITPAQDQAATYAGSMSGAVAAIDPTGNVLWKTTFPQSVFTTSPLLFGNELLFASDDGILYSISTKDGASPSKVDLHGKLALAGAGPSLVVGTEDGKVCLYAPHDLKQLAHATVGGKIQSVVVAGDSVVACTAEGLIWNLALKGLPESDHEQPTTHPRP